MGLELLVLVAHAPRLWIVRDEPLRCGRPLGWPFPGGGVDAFGSWAVFGWGVAPPGDGGAPVVPFSAVACRCGRVGVVPGGVCRPLVVLLPPLALVGDLVLFRVPLGSLASASAGWFWCLGLSPLCVFRPAVSPPPVVRSRHFFRCGFRGFVALVSMAFWGVGLAPLRRGGCPGGWSCVLVAPRVLGRLCGLPVVVGFSVVRCGPWARFVSLVRVCGFGWPGGVVVVWVAVVRSPGPPGGCGVAGGVGASPLSAGPVLRPRWGRLPLGVAARRVAPAARGVAGSRAPWVPARGGGGGGGAGENYFRVARDSGAIAEAD